MKYLDVLIILKEIHYLDAQNVLKDILLVYHVKIASVKDM